MEALTQKQCQPMPVSLTGEMTYESTEIYCSSLVRHDIRNIWGFSTPISSSPYADHNLTNELIIMRRTGAEGREAKDGSEEDGGEAKKRKKRLKSCRGAEDAS